MVRACRQPLTSSQDEMDAFTSVILAVELERKKRAFVSWRDALKSTELNSANETKATESAPNCEHHERLRADPPKPKTLP